VDCPYSAAVERPTEWGDGAAVQAVRERGVRQEWPDARQAALPLQRLWAQLHRHPAARPAAAGRGHGRPAVPERAVDEPHRQAVGRVDAQRDDLDRAVRQALRPEAGAGGARRGGRAGRDVALPKKKTSKLWVWKAWDRASGRVVDGELGGRDRATLERLLERPKRWGVRLYRTDDRAACAEAIPPGRLHVGKEETHGIERDHARQRHWPARFRRRTCVVSRALRMVEAPIALFARFGGNDRIGDPLSMMA
jgi:insertion element IS1 protein InsB